MTEDFEDSQDDFGKLSKINSAGLVNSTLSNLWLEYFRHYRHGQFLDANSDLDCVWTILGGEKGVSGSATESRYKLIEYKLQSTGVLSNSIEKKGFGKVKPEVLVRKGKQKTIINEKAIFLRRLMNKQGKGTAYNDGDDEDFE